MITLLVAVIVLALVLYILTLVQIEQPWKNILMGVIVVGFLIYVLTGAGGLHLG